MMWWLSTKHLEQTEIGLLSNQLSDEDREAVLQDIKRRLGIKPIKTRALPYVGDE